MARTGLQTYPYSPELHAVAGRINHMAGNPERALFHYRRARSLRPERWETIVWGLELALDIGDAAAAHRSWYEEQELLQQADPAIRSALAARLAKLRQSRPFSLLHSLIHPGVFPDEAS